MIALDRLYLADRGQAVAFCETCGQPIARASAYLLADAIADYRLEIGDERSSGDSIAARLKHVVDFLEDDGRASTTCADAAVPIFADRFRTWSRAQPVTWRNKAGEITRSKPRAPATTEESLIQLAAVLNHAAESARSDARPRWATLGRKQVSRPRRNRVDALTLARMLAYAADRAPNQKRWALHAFLVGSICTLARPDAVVDISTDPARRQWWPGSLSLDLLPAGRAQTKKVRPLLPVLPALGEWLQATFDLAHDPTERTGHWLVNYHGRPIVDVGKSWNTMLLELGLPREREFQPYVLRHSLATILRGAGVQQWELAGFMGHSLPGQTEVYAVEERFPAVLAAIQLLLDELNRLAPGALHRTGTGPATNVVPIGRVKMPAG